MVYKVNRKPKRYKVSYAKLVYTRHSITYFQLYKSHATIIIPITLA